MNRVAVAAGIIAVSGLLIWLGSQQDQGSDRIAPPAPPVAETPSCEANQFKVKSINAGFQNHCRRRTCMDLKGAATIVNGCTLPVGVQVKITALDGAGVALASRDLWPASTSNVAPGEYVFSLDYALDYQPGMASIRVEPIAVRQW